MRRLSSIATIVAALTALCASAAAAQSLWGINLFGEHRFPGSGRDRALGFSSVALLDSTSAITMNAASLADLGGMTLSAFELVSISKVRTEEESVGQNRFLVPTIMIAAPLRPGLVLSLGYRTRFEGRNDFAFAESPLPETPRPYSIFKHRSDLFTAPVGIAWRVVGWLRMAAELHIERGSITDEVTKTFESRGFRSTFSKRRRLYSGTSWGAAVLANPHPRIAIGAFYDHRIGYAVDEQFEFSSSRIDSSASFDFTLPAAFGLGMAVELTERYWLSSSYWRRAAPEPAGVEQFSGALNDEWLLSFGIERRRSGSGGFFSRIPLRLGYFQNLWHLQFPAGEDLTGRFITFGTGISLPGGPGSIDLSLEVGQIGSVGRNLVDDRVVRIGAGFSFSETWTKRKPGRRR